jgi:hypothetical protein
MARFSSRPRLRGLGWVVPRQYSTVGKQKLSGISKRGNVYLRRMLIHSARSVSFRVKYDTGGGGHWAHRLAQRAPRNKVVMAIANKLARIAWAELSSGPRLSTSAAAAKRRGIMAVGKGAALGKHKTFPLFHRPYDRFRQSSTTRQAERFRYFEMSNSLVPD